MWHAKLTGRRSGAARTVTREAGMFITSSRIALALVIIAIGTAAQAQRIPPSESLGRERERFTDPLPPPRAQPGPMFSLPGATYPSHRAHGRSRKARAHNK
jgi:hypothetical protein